MDRSLAYTETDRQPASQSKKLISNFARSLYTPVPYGVFYCSIITCDTDADTFASPNVYDFVLEGLSSSEISTSVS